jgi:Na+/H+ antiporter NhaD/arsenite permease-like protein
VVAVDIGMLIAIVVFIATIIAIAMGIRHRSVVALLGAVLLMVTGVLPAEEAVLFIDFNTIGLLMGMMIIVGVLSRTGVFQFIAIRTVKLTRGNVPLTFFAIAAVTAMLSAFLDNVTTVLLMSPIIISLVDLMDVNPLPFLMTEAFASNIGGTATLVGDPPNIIIGSFAGLSFSDFLVHLAPAVVMVFFFVTVYLMYLYRGVLFRARGGGEKISRVDESRVIKDKVLLFKTGVVLAGVFLGFLVHHLLHLDAAVIALFGAALLLMVIPVNGEKVLQDDIEWATLVFFAALFIVVGGLKHTGVISTATEWAAPYLKGHPILALLAVLWISGLTCCFINNVAFTATFVFIVDEMALTLGMASEPLFWALALGACFGGNGTYLGAAANIIVADMAERENARITFSTFMQTGMRVVMISLAVSSIYVVIRYGGVF